jgi:hypothetical protein
MITCNSLQLISILCNSTPKNMTSTSCVPNWLQSISTILVLCLLNLSNMDFHPSLIHLIIFDLDYQRTIGFNHNYWFFLVAKLLEGHGVIGFRHGGHEETDQLDSNRVGVTRSTTIRWPYLV